ncbi:MAG: phosphate signaling complex protein PhoU [Candidatus Eremiobacteraeota bacterium]|nr:phosphate signaling complex protein PhoU [Candidatus Eremiobacteraeota bacterium]MBV8339485.1 phosphate signaling complex protein PhoU [Candidatus Eremiobacteraeota bacterium]MBV8595239.1 phosphate signaling complex protein PhoU [Candidatus Eremiobacteraeota bacterium]MBV8669683.1 phosphate signaling complex protein PhoU [Candidatus Eremiobacteraeota bacterium]MBV8670744.1 phosphate signaling complex protein PhoU [Candidatus Eremiobacteraeota bacterium]
MGRENFHRILEETQQDVLRMGSLVEEAITKAVDALARSDVKAAEEILRADDYIDDLNVLIETNCLNLLALQQPMASDLRTIAAMLDIIIDLERIGDHAGDIAQITRNLANEPHLKPLVDIPLMAAKAREMLRESLDAFSHRDAQAAHDIPRKDDEVDRLYRKVFAELIQFMARDPKAIGRASNLLLVALYLERIADHATNICERVVYMVEGVPKKLKRSVVEFAETSRSSEEASPAAAEGGA